jgi:hypothetical protein
MTVSSTAAIQGFKVSLGGTAVSDCVFVYLSHFALLFICDTSVCSQVDLCLVSLTASLLF